MIELFIIFRAWTRLYWWNVCPECNHDAPELYECPICEHYKYLPRYSSDQTEEQRHIVWQKYLKKF